jgi:hypothetical protein
MKGVWNEVYREKRGARGQFFNPARLTNRSKAVAIHQEAQELRKKAGEKDLEDAKFLDFEATLIERYLKSKFCENGASRIALRSSYSRGLITLLSIANRKNFPTSKAKVTNYGIFRDGLESWRES